MRIVASRYDNPLVCSVSLDLDGVVLKVAGLWPIFTPAV